MKSHTQTQGGFSLVETVVYLGIIVLVAGALITTFLSLSTTLARNTAERELTHSANASLERIVRDIRSAASVNTGLSTFGTSTGALALLASGTTTRFYIANGNLMVSLNGVELGPLTSEQVTVQSLVFHHYVGSTTDMVRAALTLSATSKAASSTHTFYSSAVLRGSYE